MEPVLNSLYHMCGFVLWTHAALAVLEGALYLQQWIKLTCDVSHAAVKTTLHLQAACGSVNMAKH